jgi:hypothetical protein
MFERCRSAAKQQQVQEQQQESLERKSGAVGCQVDWLKMSAKELGIDL